MTTNSLDSDTLAPTAATLASTSLDVAELSSYAERAYLDYAMSVVRGRALPDVTDGQKPVQRRILYAMHRMGLSDKSKPVKCARFVGDIIGKYHPHGDSSVYEAAVRMAQAFTLRYPLIDGQGNFGSRDGDQAAAMRYTEARLTAISELLLGELDLGTVDFRPNYDGAFEEPVTLPARLPVGLLNGASGIAVGMATEIPSHNLAEVSLACEHLIRNPSASLEDILGILPGPDFAAGAQVISSAEEVSRVYATGRGSLRVRSRWVVEPLARGQWQVAVYELPQGVSTAKIMEEIEDLTNPQVKKDKKTLTQDQQTLKALLLSVVDKISDDSDAEHPIRLVIEPRSSRQSPDEVMQVLLAHTSLETNAPVNLVSIGLDGKPQQKSLMQMLQEWVTFRFETVTRRTKHRLSQVRAREHILEGRLVVFLNLDEVIRIIREADEPKAALIAKLGLSDVQATDILEIRLRQLANLERIKLEAELEELRKEALVLEGLLADRTKMTERILAEMAADRVKFGDPRRTLIERAERITQASVATASDDPVTLIISKHGWLRSRTGHKVDLSALTWKPGDEALAIFEARSNQTVVVLDTSGRAYNVSASAFPSGRGDGVPLTSLAELGANKLAHAFLLHADGAYLLVNDNNAGFLCPAGDLVTRQKAGKVVITGLSAGDKLLEPVYVQDYQAAGAEIAVASTNGKLLVFPLSEVKVMPKGQGVQLMSLSGPDRVAAVAAASTAFASLTLSTEPAGRKKVTSVQLAGDLLDGHRGRRARVGNFLPDKAKALRMQGTAAELTSKPVTDFGDADLI